MEAGRRHLFMEMSRTMSMPDLGGVHVRAAGRIIPQCQIALEIVARWGVSLGHTRRLSMLHLCSIG